MEMAVVGVFVVFVLAFCGCHGQDYPFRNTSLSFEDRVKVVSSEHCLNVNGAQLLHA